MPKPLGKHLHKLTPDTITEAIQCYQSGESLSVVAARFGVSRQSMWDVLRRRIQLRPQVRYGADNHFYRGGGRRFHGGYIQIYVNGQWLREHRVIMERVLGRRLLSNENVHHLNHDKTDNRPENLTVMSHSEHSRHHQTGRVHSIESIEKQRAAMRGRLSRPDVTASAVTELAASGLSTLQIAKLLGCSWPTIKRRLCQA